MILRDPLEILGGRLKQLWACLARRKSRGGVRLAVPWRIQLDNYSCGLCCARMVAEYHDHPLSCAAARQFGLRCLDGTSTTPLVRLLREAGCSVREYYAGQANLRILVAALDQKLPVIVSVPGHYVVITGYDRHYFYVHDPTLLARLSGRILRTEFGKLWTREAIIVLGPARRNNLQRRW